MFYRTLLNLINEDNVREQINSKPYTLAGMKGQNEFVACYLNGFKSIFSSLPRALNVY